MNDRKQRVRFSWLNRPTVFVLAAIVAGGVLITAWTVTNADRTMRQSLLYQARLVAQAIRPERILAL